MTSTNKPDQKADTILLKIPDSLEKWGKNKSRCYYCERQLKLPDPFRKDPLFRTKDHVVPQCRGGKGNAENIVYCCSQCNANKGGKSLWQWECFLSSRYALKKTTSTWRPLISLIIKNIRLHPLYNKEPSLAIFKQFNKPTINENEIEDYRRHINPKGAGFDQSNFHEDYAGNQ